MSMRPTTNTGLDENELVVIHAASRIFAALVASGRFTGNNQSGLIRSAVSMALELAREAARQVHGLPDLETGPAGAGEGEGDVLDLLD
jgi:Arc/MetJ-type ribon-helix-helix transcriptional regulator